MTKFITPFDRSAARIDGVAPGFAATLEVTAGALETVAEDRFTSGINGAPFGIGNTYGAGEMKVKANAHLFVLVETGLLVIESQEALFVFHPGESFVAPQGSEFVWNQEADVAFAYSSCADADAPAQIIPVLPQGARKVAPPYATENLLSAKSPRQASAVFFSDSTTRWQVGVWASETFERKVLPFPKDEYMYIHAGAAHFEDGAGEGDSVGERISFLLAHKSMCTWKNDGFISKTYCVVLDK